ncbi:MAG: hypothetical protein LBK75_11485 [Oscillospiraceae bacterium]|jgi:hypothetical protein|nr:hypothetical protein [Oscillospiraceae bacterium]
MNDNRDTAVVGFCIWNRNFNAALDFVECLIARCDDDCVTAIRVPRGFYLTSGW